MATPAVPDPTVGLAQPTPTQAPAADPSVDASDLPVPGVLGQTLVGTPTLKRPDITPAQIVGFIPIAAKLGTAFGIYTLTAAQQGALTDAVTAGIALFGADALIRLGRSLGLR